MQNAHVVFADRDDEEMDSGSARERHRRAEHRGFDRRHRVPPKGELFQLRYPPSRFLMLLSKISSELSARSQKNASDSEKRLKGWTFGHSASLQRFEATAIRTVAAAGATLQASVPP